MAFTTKLNLINQKFEQTTGGTLTLSGTTNIASTGKLEYLTDQSSYFDATPRAIPDVAYVTGRTADLSADIQYISGKTSENIADIANLATWSGETTADIAFVSAATAANTADIANLATWSGTTDAAIAANTADIAVLAAWSGTTDAAIAANTADIANLATWSGETDQYLEYLSGQTDLKLDITDFNVYSGATDTRISGIEDDIAYLSAQTDTKLDITDFATYTGATDTRLDGIEVDIDYISGVTTTKAVFAAYTGATEIRLDTIEGQYITGGTSGLLPDGVDVHSLKLGGAITEDTTLFGSHDFNVSATEIRLTGGTAIYLDGGLGGVYALDLIGGNDLVCVDTTTGLLGTTSLSAFGGITGGTNGIAEFLNYRLGLGGALTQDTTILGAANDLSITGLEDLTLTVTGQTSLSSGTLLIASSGATFTDNSASPAGIVYADDYSTTFTNNSLVTKYYVDTIATGLIPHAAALVATTGDTTLSGLQIIDGVQLVDGDRVLVKDQTDGTTNGIYIAHAGAWTRADDFNYTPVGEISNGDLVPVLSGDTYTATIWILTTENPITTGSTLTFVLFSKMLGVIEGNGINITPSGTNQEISVELAANSGLEFVGTGLSVDNAIAGIGLTWNNGVLDVNAVSGEGDIDVKYDGTDYLVVSSADINTALGGVLSGSTNGLTDSVGVVELGGSLTKATTITSPEGTSLTFSDTHSTSKVGILYAADYCASFTDRSLVDKAYVVRYTTGLTSGLDSRIDLLESWSATTETRVDNLETDVTALGAVSGITLQSITGVTNGLTKVGAHSAKLGGALTENTTITGAFTLGFSNTVINLTGSSAVNVSSSSVKLTQSLPAGTTSDMLVVRDSGGELQGLAVSAITSSLIPVTGASNGLSVVNKEVVLGGTLDTGVTTTVTVPDYTSTLKFVDGGSCLNFNSGAIGICDVDGWEVTVDGLTNAVYLGKSAVSQGTLSNDGVYFSSTGGSAIRICSGDVDICGTPFLPNVNYSVPFDSENDGILFRNADDKSVRLVSLDTLISGITTTAITGATNGLTKLNQNAELGGNLYKDTTITGAFLLGVNTTTINLTGTTVNLGGVVTLKTVPASGDTATDSVLVRDASTGAIQQIPASSLGQDNNDYEKAIVTTSTGLTTSSPYVILVNHTAPVTITLPATPFDGQAFKIKDAANDALTNNITIARNGNNIDTQESDAVINTDSGALELVYDSTLGWFTLAFVN